MYSRIYLGLNFQEINLWFQYQNFEAFILHFHFLLYFYSVLLKQGVFVVDFKIEILPSNFIITKYDFIYLNLFIRIIKNFIFIFNQAFMGVFDLKIIPFYFEFKTQVYHVFNSISILTQNWFLNLNNQNLINFKVIKKNK